MDTELRCFYAITTHQKCKLVEILSESDSHRDVIGYFVHESKKCLVRTKRDMVLFLHCDYTVTL